MSEAATAFNLVLLLLLIETTEKEIKTLHERGTKLNVTLKLEVQNKL